MCVAECQEVKHKKTHRKHSTSQAATPQQITSDEQSIIVPASWMKEYKKIEKTRGEIPEDSQIWQDGDRYHIPREVAQHYIEAKK